MGLIVPDRKRMIKDISTKISTDPRSTETRRHHIHERTDAVLDCNIPVCHSHSNHHLSQNKRKFVNKTEKHSDKQPSKPHSYRLKHAFRSDHICSHRILCLIRKY